jgi:hypothetical protein
MSDNTPKGSGNDRKHRYVTLEMHVDDVERLKVAMAEGKLADLGIKRVRVLEPLLELNKHDWRHVELLRGLHPKDKPFRE